MSRERSLTAGERLYHWLLKRYNITAFDEGTWIRRIADDFRMDGFDDLLRESSVLMTLRRLLCNYRWYNERYTNATAEYEKAYLNYHLAFSDRDAADLTRLVHAAHLESISDPRDRLSHQMHADGLRKGTQCAICGRDIDYSTNTTEFGWSLDHIWPRNLGGSSEEFNLRLTHKICNNRRQDLVSGADIHYEHFHVKSEPSTDPDSSYLRELSWAFRFGVYLRSNFTCEQCGRPADQVNGLYIHPRENAENLNIFNAVATCATCQTPQQRGSL